MVLKEVKNHSDYQGLKKLSIHGPVFLLKHSITSQVSVKALEDFNKFNEAYAAAPCFVLMTQNFRALSDKIVADTELAHESPQVIVFLKGKPIWNADHAKVNFFKLEEVLKVHATNIDVEQTDLNEFETFESDLNENLSEESEDSKNI